VVGARLLGIAVDHLSAIRYYSMVHHPSLSSLPLIVFPWAGNRSRDRDRRGNTSAWSITITITITDETPITDY
jgi:hypothetical protein